MANRSSLRSSRVLLPLLLAVALAAGVIAGCGSSNGLNSSDAAAETTSTAVSAMAGMIPLVSGANGTSASAAGLTLRETHTPITAGHAAKLTLTVLNQQDKPITSFERDQTKLMHLIVVRRDLTHYQHIHPILGGDGRFTVALSLPTSGAYRAIADFTTSGRRYALGVGLTAPGPRTTTPLAPGDATVSVDGYTVTITHPSAFEAGRETPVTFTVTRSGKPVTALETYLGAYGHLVALRSPDLAYSHVHPVAHNPSAGTITFSVDLPTAARYRLFLQFRAAGSVHTPPFTVTAH